jgi:hypothetical protein
MVDDIGGGPDVRRGVVRQHGVAAVRVAGTAGKVATRNIHLEAAASRKGMMEIAQMNLHPLSAAAQPQRSDTSRALGDQRPRKGRTLVLHLDNFLRGYGDILMRARYASLITGGQVVLVCPPPLIRLLQRCPGAPGPEASTGH